MPELSRRGFLTAVLSAGAAAAVPLELLGRVSAAAAASGRHFFVGARTDLYAVCDAICARVAPDSPDPVTGEPQPGGLAARAVDFIDLFLAAFEPGVAGVVTDNPPIWLHGRYSGRNPYPDPATGMPSASAPPDDFGSLPDGVGRFLALSPHQELGWRAQLYGAHVISADPSLPAAYRARVADGTIPVPQVGLRDVYDHGLRAFDSWSGQLFGTGFAAASPQQQDLMLEAAGNVVLGGVFGNIPLPAVAPPPDAIALFVPVSVHTFQACFGLPEYGSRGGPPMWRWIVCDGDTQPLGNSVYDENLDDAAIRALGGEQGLNDGFGDPAGYRPSGGYREYRRVSTIDTAGAALTDAQLRAYADLLRRHAAPRRG